jgi:two-component system response regulator DegU
LTQPIRVLLADDHAMFRDSLGKLLRGKAGIQIVGQASNGSECIEMLGKLKPDILLIDLHMPGKDGLEVLEQTDLGATRAIILTGEDDETYAVRAMSLGAACVVFKQSPTESLINCILVAHSGEI